jgi:hypothetical protein
MECPEGGATWAANNHCYYPISESLGATSLQRASAACGAGGHVVTLASEAEFEQVVPLVAPGKPFWVGLDTGSLPPGSYGSVESFEPGWSSRCTGCYAQHADAGPPLPVFPDASLDGGTQDCVAAFADPSQPWNEFPCRGLRFVTLDVVCEVEPVGLHSTTCDAGICIDLAKTHGSKTYVYEATPAAADAASTVCEGLGGTLVVLQSSDEREQLWQELSRLTVVPTAVWIGLSQTSPASSHVAATWQWDDHTPSDGPNAAYPSQDGLKRAFLYQSQAASEVDDTLASNQASLAPGGALPYVCELRL